LGWGDVEEASGLIAAAIQRAAAGRS